MSRCKCGKCQECDWVRSHGDPPEYSEFDHKVDLAFDEIRAELLAAIEKFPPLHSFHEGHSVMREELEELWDEVKAWPKNSTKEKMRAEAMQVAAMAIRFMVDLT